MSSHGAVTAPARPFLLCIDALTLSSDCDPGPAYHPQWSINASALLTHARHAGWSVGHVACARPPAGAERWTAVGGLGPRPDEPVFHRAHPSAFSNAALSARICGSGAELIVIGTSVGGSCLTTAVDAACMGLRLTLAEDSIAISSQEREGLKGLARLSPRTAGAVRMVRTSLLLNERPGLRLVQGGLA